MNNIFSGIQPSGKLHLGNYLGAIKSWLELQKDTNNQTIFCIVDLHAITVPQDPVKLRKSILRTAATYIACGLDINNSTIFVQSSVPEHTQLAWVLSCITPIGWLNRMTQFKDKTTQNKSLASLGLYSYPALMAADILLYKSTHVPVGDDQKQHIELTRDIAQAFNNLYSLKYFPLPEIITPKTNSRVMSLKDGTIKMSKSDPSDYSRINLCDPPDTIRKKIAKAKSDSIIGFDPKTLSNRPEARNLIEILANFNNTSVESICNDIDNFITLKSQLADSLISSLENIRIKIERLTQEIDSIKQILVDGTTKAREVALHNLTEVNKIIGI